MSLTIEKPRFAAEAPVPAVELLHAVFEGVAAVNPGCPAIEFPGETLNYGMLEGASNRLARHLRSQGVGRGDYVGLLLSRSPEVYVALLAILKAGAAYVPIDPDCPRDRALYMLADCQARALVTSSGLADRHAGFAGEVVALDLVAAELASRSDDRLLAHETGVTPNDICYVIYTSGSTGRPKGVQVEHRNVCHFLRAERSVFGVRTEDRVYQGFSIAFDASVEEIWLAFAAGACLVVGTSEMVQSGPSVAKALSEAGVTVLSTVPTLISCFEDELPTVRLLILGGEPCQQDLVSRWCRDGRRMVNTYGPTEATVVATYADCDPNRPVTIGKPLPGYTIELLDEHRNPVPDGDPGEICIGGAGVARGYLGMPELTRERFFTSDLNGATGRSSWTYRSGDVGRRNADGEIEFLGRVDCQVKLRGFRIELTEIESVLLESPGVLACAVALREDHPNLPQLVAYVVARGARPIDAKAIQRTVRSRLPAYMIPSRIETVDALPTLPSGKVDRGRLPAPRVVEHDDPEGDEPEGMTEVERKIFQVWRRFFAPLAVTTQDDFFRDLPGHSLFAARMVSELRNDLQFRTLSVLDVYQNPTIASLASKWEEILAVTTSLSDLESKLEEEGSSQGTANGGRRHRLWDRAYLLCGLGQAVGLYFVLAFFSLQWLAPYLVYTGMVESGVQVGAAILAALGALVLVYPVMLLISIAVKWLVIGRYKAGSYPVWGFYFLRCWFVGAIQSIVPVDYMAGTPLLGLYYRLMGARIGANVHFGNASAAVFDLLSVGDDTCIGTDSNIGGSTVEAGLLKIGPITIGRSCFIGARTVVRENVVMEDRSKLEDLSLLPAGARVPRCERWAGSPAQRITGARAACGEETPARASLARRFLMGVLHAIGLFVFPVMVTSAFLPGLVWMNRWHRMEGGYTYLLAAPLVALSFVVLLCLEIAAVKWLLLGRVQPGRFRMHGGRYWRHWFVEQLMELSLDVIGPLYATIYLIPWYRSLGATLGVRSEISTASFISPDLLTMGDEGFIADAVSLGAPRVEDGQVTIDHVRIGHRAFVGNSALLPPGAEVGDNSLIGVMTIPPKSTPGSLTPGTSWLGSPALFLPERQQSTAFERERTFRPSRKLWLERGAIELIRVTLPATCFVVLTGLLLSSYFAIQETLSTPVLILVFPVLYAAFGLLAALFTVALKWVVIGRYRPGEHPLWSPFVWRTELVSAVHEHLACLFFVEMLHGTPFSAWYYRLLGMKVGKRVFMNTGEVTEFDLVDIGDDAVLNEDCTLQTHLFEDRVMKVSKIQIGARCSVGGMAVVLYDSRMEEGSALNDLSLLMKGEDLPAGTFWEGIPARSVRRDGHAPESSRRLEVAAAGF